MREISYRCFILFVWKKNGLGNVEASNSYLVEQLIKMNKWQVGKWRCYKFISCFFIFALRILRIVFRDFNQLLNLNYKKIPI